MSVEAIVVKQTETPRKEKGPKAQKGRGGADRKAPEPQPIIESIGEYLNMIVKEHGWRAGYILKDIERFVLQISKEPRQTMRVVAKNARAKEMYQRYTLIGNARDSADYNRGVRFKGDAISEMDTLEQAVVDAMDELIRFSVKHSLIREDGPAKEIMQNDPERIAAAKEKREKKRAAEKAKRERQKEKKELEVEAASASETLEPEVIPAKATATATSDKKAS